MAETAWSVDRLHAYSIKKGCYPGQEIVARTHFLGQAKRGLVLFDTDDVVGIGVDVVGDGRTLGTVISSGADLALAVLPLDRDPGTVQADGITLRETPLLDGLAR